MVDIERVKKILTAPAREWPVIAEEPASIGGLIRGYLGWLALVPAIAGFIGMSVIGMGAFGVTVRIGVMQGIAQAVVSVVATLLMAWLVSLVVNWLAPRFGGTPDPIAAFKVVAYASTAALVAGIAQVFPILGFVSLIGAAYSIYLLHIGLPVLMKSRPSAGYTALTVIGGIVIGFVVGMLMHAMTPWHGPGAMSDAARVTIETPEGRKEMAPERTADIGRRLEEARQRMEAASKSGDPQAMAKATRESLASIAGSAGGRKPIAPAELKALLPDTVASLPRTGFEAEQSEVMGMSVSKASARYVQDQRSVKIEIVDTGSAAGVVSILAGWANRLVDRETETTIEKVYRSGDRSISEKTRRDGSSAEYKVMLANGIGIDIRGRQVPLDELKALAERLDLNRLEARK